MHIAIAGNIGCGKTTLTAMLAEHFGWEARQESTDDNPYLKDFYGDMRRWSFPLQIYFMNHRFGQVNALQAEDRIVIQDRSVYEDAFVFSRALHANSMLDEREYGSFRNLFEVMVEYVRPPEVLIYLRTDLDRLMAQIQKRGRDYEQQIERDYVARLNQYYEEWISSYSRGKLLIVDMSERDFVARSEDFDHIADQLASLLQTPAEVASTPTLIY